MTVDDPSTDENLREKVLNFIRDKVRKLTHSPVALTFLLFMEPKINCLHLQVFPLKAELLKPQEQMERHITNLIKKVCL